jgi:hypothetical protein
MRLGQFSIQLIALFPDRLLRLATQLFRGRKKVRLGEVPGLRLPNLPFGQAQAKLLVLLPGQQHMQELFSGNEMVHLFLRVRLDHYQLHRAREGVAAGRQIGRYW